MGRHACEDERHEVYRYFYTRPRPAMRTQNTPPARGAAHSAEIEYALGNLKLNDVYAWTEDDFKVSNVMQSYFANFIKKGDPNGAGLPEWPAVTSARVMRLDVESRAEPDNDAREISFSGSTSEVDGDRIYRIFKMNKIYLVNHENLVNPVQPTSESCLTSP